MDARISSDKAAVTQAIAGLTTHQLRVALARLAGENRGVVYSTVVAVAATVPAVHPSGLAGVVITGDSISEGVE